jgi:hypothetical protein
VAARGVRVSRTRRPDQRMKVRVAPRASSKSRATTRPSSPSLRKPSRSGEHSRQNPCPGSSGRRRGLDTTPDQGGSVQVPLRRCDVRTRNSPVRPLLQPLPAARFRLRHPEASQRNVVVIGTAIASSLFGTRTGRAFGPGRVGPDKTAISRSWPEGSRFGWAQRAP